MLLGSGQWTISGRVESLFGEIAFELQPEYKEGVIHSGVKNSIPGRSTSKCKCSELGIRLRLRRKEGGWRTGEQVQNFTGFVRYDKRC